MITRRTFLVGASAAAVLAACGSDDSTKASGSESLLAFFDPNNAIVAGTPQRLPFGYGNKDGVPNVDGPASLTFIFSGPSIVAKVTANKVTEGLPRPIWVPVATFAKPGTYTVSATAKHGTIDSTFVVLDPKEFTVPAPGAQMPKVDTPTSSNHRGVEPYCTKQTPCALHAMTLTDALNNGKPTAFLIATPAHCKTVVCGPTLDFLVAESANYAGKINCVHAEVYADADATELAPIIKTLNLGYEPVLFCMDKSGKIIERLDGVFGAQELREALKRLAA